jgi:hypothetical protein
VTGRFADWVPQNRQKRWSLEVLWDMGGHATVREVEAELERRIGHLLNSADWETLPSGRIRWRHNVVWAGTKRRMVGLAGTDGRVGRWVTETGRRALREGWQF